MLQCTKMKDDLSQHAKQAHPKNSSALFAIQTCLGTKYLGTYLFCLSLFFYINKCNIKVESKPTSHSTQNYCVTGHCCWHLSVSRDNGVRTWSDLSRCSNTICILLHTAFASCFHVTCLSCYMLISLSQNKHPCNTIY